VATVISRDSWRASLARPPIDRLPPDAGSPDVLTTFVEERARSWGGVPVALSPRVTAALWAEAALVMVFSGFLLAVRSGVTPCSGIACTVATLGDQPVVALVLALTCVAAMAVAMPMTWGLSRADGPRLAVIVIAALCGLIALAGVLLLLFVLGLALTAFAAVVDRF
jgi:hypothetical protein